MPTRCAIYARVSSAAQRDAHTIEAQLAILPAHAERQGWTVVGTFVDDGRSAKSGRLAKRAGLARLLEAVRARACDVVLVVDLDRLTRSESIEERGAILGAFQAGGVKVATPAGGELDLATSHGDLLATLQAWVAADWGRKHVERITAGKERALAGGRKPAGPTPFGLTYNRWSSTPWGIDPARAPVIVEIFERAARGETLSEIGLALDRPDVPQPRSGRWLVTKVRQTINAETYVGRWHYGTRGRAYVVPVPAIVSEDLRDAAIAASARWERRGHARTRRVYMLEGLATCARCGARVRISASGGTTAAAYVCAHRMDPRYYRAPRCGTPRWPVPLIERELQAGILEIAADPEFLARLLEERRGASTEERDAWRRDLDAADRALRRLALAEDRALGLLRRGAASEAAVEREVRQIGRERLAHERQRETAQRAAVAAGGAAHRTEAAVELLAAVRDRLAHATPLEWQRTAREFLDDVELGDDGLSARWAICAAARQDAPASYGRNVLTLCLDRVTFRIVA